MISPAPRSSVGDCDVRLTPIRASVPNTMSNESQNIGPHDWYREAATYLVKQQRADGSWPPSSEKATDVARQTAFALLVLERATVPTGYGPPPTTGGVEDEPQVNGEATSPDAPKPGEGPPPK